MRQGMTLFLHEWYFKVFTSDIIHTVTFESLYCNNLGNILALIFNKMTSVHNSKLTLSYIYNTTNNLCMTDDMTISCTLTNCFSHANV